MWPASRSTSSQHLDSAGRRHLRPTRRRMGQPEPDIALLLAGGALCNDAVLEPDDDGDERLSRRRRPHRGRAGGGGRAHGPVEGRSGAALAARGRGALHLRAQAHDHRARVPGRAARPRRWTCAICLALLPQAPYVAFTKGSVDGLLQHLRPRAGTKARSSRWTTRGASASSAANDGLAQERHARAGRRRCARWTRCPSTATEESAGAAT